MDDFKKMIKHVHDAKAGISSDLDQLGGVLRCTQCGYELPLEAGDAGRYLFNGWPKCPRDGSGMRWVTAKELKAEQEDG